MSYVPAQHEKPQRGRNHGQRDAGNLVLQVIHETPSWFAGSRAVTLCMLCRVWAFGPRRFGSLFLRRLRLSSLPCSALPVPPVSLSLLRPFSFD